jgi:protein phosphatase 1G
MGPYLTVPRKEKESVDGENSRVAFSAQIIILCLL